MSRTREGGPRGASGLELVVGALGVLAVALVAVGLWRTSTILDRNHRLDETPEQVALELGRAQFALDETLAQEADVDPRTEVVDRVSAALATCREGLTLVFEAESRSLLEALCGGVEELRGEVLDAIRAAAVPGVSEEALDELEEPLDGRFARVLSAAERADLEVEESIDRSQASIVRLEMAVLAMVAALVVGILLVIRRGRRSEAERRAELEAQTSRLEEAQRLANVGSFELDLATGESTWSAELYRILGVDPESFRPGIEGVRALVHPEDREAGADDVEEAVLAGETWDYEFRIVRPDGEVRWVHARGRGEAGPSGEPARVVGTFQDVTDRRRATDALRRGLDQQRAAADRLRALEEMKQALLTAVSHHVRTPLTSILGFSTLLAERDLDPEQQRDLARRVLESTEELEALLTELMDVDRFGREFVEVRRVPTDVASLVREEADAFGDGRPVTVEAASVEAEVDPEAVRRVLRQLLENADRFSPSGDPVEIGVEVSEDGDVLLRVDDAGPGVPEGLHTAIFEPFRQGAEIRGHSPGLGVGLAMVARLARLHGGRAWVENRAEGGASFRVLLRGSAGADDEGETTKRIRRLLAVGRRHLGMDLAFVSRMTDEAELFLYVEGKESFSGIEAGSSLPVEETYCSHMLSGQIPQAVPDAEAVGELRELRITHEAGIGAYVGVPVVLGDGSVYGALCCISKRSEEDLGDRDVAFLRMLGELVALELEPGARASAAGR